MQDIFSTIGTSWFFWVILIIVIAFIVYSGLKKRKSEKVEKQKRENEVRNLIKDHLKKTDNLTNVVVEYLDVKLRRGRLYKGRDVYDVFLAIKNPRTKKTVTKKAYEIEGFAKPVPNKKKEITVSWTINREFPFDKHKETLADLPSSSTSIYFKSLFKKDRSRYIKREKEVKEDLEKRRKEMDDKLKKLDKEEVIFAPKPKIKKDN